MIALGLLVCAQSGLGAVIADVRAGDVRVAWERAGTLADPLERAQGRVYVRHHSGDLVGAWRESATATQAFPDDLWIAERAVYIGTSLGHAEQASTALAHFEALFARSGAEARGPYRELLETARADVSALRAAAEARARAETRARVVVLVAGVGTILVLVFASRANGRVAT